MYRKKFVTKFLSIALAVSMMTSVLPMNAYAANIDPAVETNEEVVEENEDTTDEGEESEAVDDSGEEADDSVETEDTDEMDEVSEDESEETEEESEDLLIDETLTETEETVIEEEELADVDIKYKEYFGSSTTYVDLTPKTGNTLVYIKGEFACINDVGKAETTIANMRTDAWKSGLKNPDSLGGGTLAEGCYTHRNTTTMRYSSGLEAIAKQRALEMALSNNLYVRPNGTKGNSVASNYNINSVLFSDLTAVSGGQTIKSTGEIRVVIEAKGNPDEQDPIAEALEFLKGRKSTYKASANHLVDQAAVRDYYNLIRPWHASFGAAAFKIENSNKYAVVFEFGYRVTGTPSGQMDPKNGKYDVEPYTEEATKSLTTRTEGFKVEIAKAAVKGYDLGGIDDVVFPGTTGQFYEGLQYTLVNCLNGNNSHVSGIFESKIEPTASNSLITITGNSYKVGSSTGECEITYANKVNGTTTTKTKKIQIINEDDCLFLKAPDKLVYVIGEDKAIDLTGGYAKIMTNEDPTHKEIKLTTDNTKPRDKADFSEAGTYTYVVKIGKYEKTFDITVKDPPVKEKQIFGGLPSITLIPKKGNALTYVKGSFFPVQDMEKLETRTYDIRFDATKNALTNPQSATGTRLLSPTYKDRNTFTMKYSGEMEALARQRAIECSLYFVDGSTVRPNGDKVLSGLQSYNGVSFVGIKDEIKVAVPGTSKDPINDAINIVLNQKAKYNRDTYLSYAVKDFRALIDPLNACFGAAAFKMEGSDKYCVIIEVGARKTGRVPGKDKITPDTPDVEPWPTHLASNCVTVEKGFPVEIAQSYYGNQYIVTGIRDAVQPNSTGKVTCGVNFTIPNSITGNNTHFGEIAGMEFKVADGAEDYITVDDDGNYKIKDKTGIFELKINVGTQSASKKIEVQTNEAALTFTPPTKRVFYIGETFDFSSGSYIDNTIADKTGHKPQKLDNINTTPKTELKDTGVYTFVTRVGDFTREFDVLLIKQVELDVDYGEDINSILPSDEFGHYEISAEEEAKIRNSVGIHDTLISFIPAETDKYPVHTKVPARFTVRREFKDTDEDIEIIYADDSFTYCGYKINPSFTVKLGDAILKQNTDYTVTYGDLTHDNMSASTTDKNGLITITGKGKYYSGSYSEEFAINPITLLIIAKDYTFGADTNIDDLPKLITKAEGLLADHKVVFNGDEAECDYLDGGALAVGEYDVEPIIENAKVVDLNNNDVTDNYIITSVSGVVKVISNLISYNVYFINPFETDTEVVNVAAGDYVDEPVVTPVSSYEFKGWYKDSVYKTKWNFDTDLVQNDIFLYARWVKTTSGDFRVEQIADQLYTGGRIVPKFAVYDGDTLLTINKDYVLRYFNNVNVNNTKATDVYNSQIPYVTVTGRGNYSGFVNINFNIVPVTLGDGYDPVNGVVLGCKDFFLKSAAAQKTVTSLKCKKALVQNTDYTVMLLTNKAYNDKGEYVAKGTLCDKAMIPANWYGSFDVVVEGLGNYDGQFIKTVTVSDNLHCINRAAVSIDTKYRNCEFTGRNIELPSAAVVVKIGATVLKYGRDYVLEYTNNEAVGIATLTVRGIGDYWGYRNASFTIKGKAFNNRTVLAKNVEAAYPYTGKPVVINNATLIYIDSNGSTINLVPGVDYHVTYVNNIKKGTATATFIGNEAAGYTGKYIYRYRINATDISDTNLVDSPSLTDITGGLFSITGATINNQVTLTNIESGIELKDGVDYSIIYVKNRVLSGAKAIASVRGKGNYSGIINYYFDIDEKDVDDASITFTVAPVAFNPAARLSTVYRPAVVVKDGKATVSRAFINVECKNCDQESLLNYFNTGSGEPYAIIKAVDGKGYTGTKIISLPFYKLATRLTTANTYIVVDSTVYNNGAECRPNVRVYYSTNAANITTVKRYKFVNDSDIKGILGDDSLLDEDQYTISWRSNILAGANRGTVVINGVAPDFGGSVSARFSISTKEIKF